jgi:hypothetical protein
MPVTFDIGWITRRHYLWGFLFSLIAVYLLKRWEEHRKSIFLFFSVLSALLALLCKEVYIIVPAAVFVVSSGSNTDKLKKTFIYLTVLVIYLPWRIYMLDGLGGYPGFLGGSLLSLTKNLIFLPMEMSKNIFGFSLLPFVLFGFMAFLRKEILFRALLAAIITFLPFVFFPSGSFLFANKALIFVAVVIFGISYVLNEISLKSRKLTIAMIFLLFMPLVLGSIVKSRDSQSVIISLSDNYEKATQALLENRDKKILIVSNYSYYFSNLEDIYRNMLKNDFPVIRSLSTVKIVPYLENNDFEGIIVANNFSLDPDTASLSSVKIITGEEAVTFINEQREEVSSKQLLPAPDVRFIKTDEDLKIDIHDTREGKFLRCVHMGSYVGCYEIPREYEFKLNKVKKIEKVDIIYITHEGIMSQPASFRSNNE